MPIRIVRNDITKMPVDAIVNAANRRLLGGGGVDGAIHRAAGPRLLEACRALGGCEVGQAKITPGFNLPCRYVIHTVGPVWQDGSQGERESLTACYRNALELAAQNGCESVAFPLISAGTYGYPRAEALRVAMDTAAAFLQDHDLTVYLVLFDRNTVLVSQKLFADVTQYIDDNYERAHTDPFSTRLRRLRAAQAAQAEIESVCADECMEEFPCAGSPKMMSAPPPIAPAAAPPGRPARSLDEALARLDESFSQCLLRLIAERGMTNPECYKRANIDRKLFSKIRNNAEYKPEKRNAVAFAIALKLDREQTADLLQKAGFALGHSSKFDVIVEYFIQQRKYDINLINQTLFSFDQELLGS